MHRIDTPSSIAGQFNDNLSIQNPGTQVSAAWANDVQENLCQTIEGAGLSVIKGEGGQLLAAIEALLDRLQPIGAVVLLDGPNDSASLCEIDTEYLRADYPRLVAYYTDQARLIAGSTGAHFRTPPYEGRFPRFTSTDAVVDPDGPRDPGSLQGHMYAQHQHSIPARDNANSGTGYVEDADSSAAARSTFTGLSGGTETRGVNVALRPVIRGR